MNIFVRLNWIDVVAIIIFLRSAYSGSKIGLTPELVKLIGTAVGIIVGFHYYLQLANTVLEYASLPVWLAQFLILFIVTLSIRTIVKYVAAAFFKLIKVQFVSNLEKAGGAIAGLARGFLTNGLLLILLLIVPVEYVQRSICEKSSLSPYLVEGTKNVYTSVIKIIPNQEARDLGIPSFTKPETKPTTTPKPATPN